MNILYCISFYKAFKQALCCIYLYNYSHNNNYLNSIKIRDGGVWAHA